MNELFNEIYNMLFESAKDFVAEDKQVPALVGVFSKNVDDDAKLTGIFFDVSEMLNIDKDAVATLFKEALNLPGALASSYVCEAWQSTDVSVLPSQDPKRTECVMISVMAKDWQVLRMCNIDRATKTLKPAEDMPGMQFQGRFVREDLPPRH